MSCLFRCNARRRWVHCEIVIQISFSSEVCPTSIARITSSTGWSIARLKNSLRMDRSGQKSWAVPISWVLNAAVATSLNSNYNCPPDVQMICQNCFESEARPPGARHSENCCDIPRVAGNTFEYGKSLDCPDCDREDEMCSSGSRQLTALVGVRAVRDGHMGSMSLS
jgi:hypothetical protein